MAKLSCASGANLQKLQYIAGGARKTRYCFQFSVLFKENCEFWASFQKFCFIFCRFLHGQFCNFYAKKLIKVQPPFHDRSLDPPLPFTAFSEKLSWNLKTMTSVTSSHVMYSFPVKYFNSSLAPSALAVKFEFRNFAILFI